MTPPADWRSREGGSTEITDLVKKERPIAVGRGAVGGALAGPRVGSRVTGAQQEQLPGRPHLTTALPGRHWGTVLLALLNSIS